MNEESKLSKLQKGLYSRSAPDIAHKSKVSFKPEQNNVPTDWQHPEEVTEEEQPIHYEDTGMSFYTKLFIGSLVFFVLALGISLFLLFKGANIVSADNIDISVSGPLSVGAGDDFAFDVQVYNKNNIKLEVVDLTVEFPSGTVNPDDTTAEYKRFKQLLPDIEPGTFSQKTIRTILYGEENSKKTIMVKVEYRIKGSNALYYKEKPYEVVISAAPVSMSITSFKEIQSNQEFEVTIQVSSNSQQVLKNMMVRAYYPFGFTFTSSDVKPLTDNATWRLGDLKPQEKRTIKIKGRIEGQDEEERVFRFSTGLQSAKSDKVIGTEFVASTQALRIKKPFLTTTLVLDGNTGNADFVTPYDKVIPAQIEWFNNLPDAVTDVEIRVKFSGIIFDKNSVDPDEGLFKSADNEIIWNTQTTPELRKVGAGDSGRVSFNFTPRAQVNQANPTMKVDVSISAKRVSEENVPEKLVSSALRNIKIASNAGLSAVVVRSTGPFQNTGPMPPRAEQVTTYTVIWSIANSTSNIANAEVRATLPAYVKWVGKVSPDKEQVTYNSRDGSIVWAAGDIPANTANGSRKEVAFQIALEPSVNQVGKSLLTLVNESTFKAIDIFTSTTIESERSALTTRFSTDPQFKNGDEIVSP